MPLNPEINQGVLHHQEITHEKSASIYGNLLEGITRGGASDRKINFSHNGKDWTAQIKFEGQEQTAKHIEFEIHDPLSEDEDDIAAIFLGRLEKDTQNSDRKIWNIYSRKVEKPYRKNGLGKLGLEAMERIVLELAKRYQETDEIELKLSTGVSAMARMIIDQDWLKQHGLSEFCHKNNDDLSYLPAGSKEEVAALLKSGTSDIHSAIAEGSYKSISFSKKIERKSIS